MLPGVSVLLQVLTGRYTAKIDMFSFGVLCVQMCTGQYPSIETRAEHIGNLLLSLTALSLSLSLYS